MIKKFVPLITSFLTFDLQFFFLQTRFVQFMKKRHNKSPTRYQERKNASNFEQQLRSNFKHTQPTPHTDTTTHHTLTHKQMYTSKPELKYKSTSDNVQAALLVAVQVPKPQGAGIETRCRLFYGLFGRCHGECGLLVQKGDGQWRAINTSRGKKNLRIF